MEFTTKVLLNLCAVLCFLYQLELKETQFTLTSTSASGTSQLFLVASGPSYFLNPTDVLNFIQSLFQTCNCRILMPLHCALLRNSYLSNSSEKITFKNECIACSCLQNCSLWFCLDITFSTTLSIILTQNTATIITIALFQGHGFSKVVTPFHKL